MLIQEADELLYSYSAGAEGASYVLELTGDTLKASEFMDSLNNDYINIRIQDKQSFEPALRDNNAIDFFDLFTKTEIIKMLPEDVTYNLYKYRLIRPFSYAVVPLIKKIKQLSTIDKDMLFCMSDPDNGNFRNKKAIRKPYKGNRRVCLVPTTFNGIDYMCLNSSKAEFMDITDLEHNKAVACTCKTHGHVEEGSRKPFHYNELKEYLINNYNTQFMYGLEADDGLGMLFSDPSKTMSHIDKDIKQLPGNHLNWQTMEKYAITKEQGLDFFLEQCLTGDGTDNIPSCLQTLKSGKVGTKGYGKTTALKLLNSCEDIKSKVKAVRDAYLNAYGDDLGMDYMIECADLVGMGQSETLTGLDIKSGSAQLLELILKHT